MRSAATYRIFGGPGLTAEEVTRRLGTRPTTETGSLWCLSTPTEDTEPAARVERLPDVLEPYRAELW